MSDQNTTNEINGIVLNCVTIDEMLDLMDTLRDVKRDAAEHEAAARQCRAEADKIRDRLYRAEADLAGPMPSLVRGGVPMRDMIRYRGVWVEFCPRNGAYYIAMGQPGFNGRINNASGFASAQLAAAESHKYRRYTGDDSAR